MSENNNTLGRNPKKLNSDELVTISDLVVKKPRLFSFKPTLNGVPMNDSQQSDIQGDGSIETDDTPK